MHDAASITQDLEVQEQSWDTEGQSPSLEEREDLHDKVTRVLREQDELFEKQRRRNKILKRATIPYLDPDVPEIEINRLDSGRWEAKVMLSGGGDTTSLAIRDLLSMTLKMLEELI